MTLPTRPPATRPAPLNVRQGQNRLTRTLSSFDNMSPLTPGTDDTPYIRFAIEQLTRDEELLGHGRHGSIIEESYVPRPTIPSQQSVRDSKSAPLQPPQPPRREPSQRERPTQKPGQNDVLLYVSPAEGQQWSDIGFVPTILRLPLLTTFMLLCLFMITGIIFSNVFALKNHGLYDYDGISTPRYFVFQYLPQLLGIILIIWLFAIEAAVYRVLPYFSMSIRCPHDRVLQDVPIHPANCVWPDLTFFRVGEPLMGVVFLIFWLTNFTIPLLSCLYQTQWILNDGPDRWRWTAVQGVGWTLVVLYLLLVVAVAYCAIRFRKRNSGLMWDPVSLADLIPLFQRSNMLNDFDHSEVAASVPAAVPPKFLRLGYWNTSQGHQIFHAVGEENASIGRLSWRKSSNNEKIDLYVDVEGQRDSRSSSFTRNIHSPYVRYRWVPWFLRDGAIIAWIVIAIILLVAFLVVSFVNHAVSRGFFPLLPSNTRAGGFSASNFLFSFLPSLLGTFLFLAWQPIDTYFCVIQPFANLASPSGACAKRSLLLAYHSQPPVYITIRALLNRDYKLAYISLITLFSATIPILAGGIFTAQLFPTSQQVRMVAAMPGYYALCFFMATYALSFLIIWPTRKRYLPHNINTIAGQLSFLYASPLLNEPGLRDVKSKRDLRERLSGVPSGFTGDGRPRDRNTTRTSRYAFGIYQGRDGKEHLGIDRLQRPGSGEMLVRSGMKR